MDAACIKTNYYALIVAVLRNCMPETAFEIVQADHPDSVRPKITKADVEDMVKFKAEGLTYKEIGAMYGIANKFTIEKRIKRYKPTKEVITCGGSR